MIASFTHASVQNKNKVIFYLLKKRKILSTISPQVSTLYTFVCTYTQKEKIVNDEIPG